MYFFLVIHILLPVSILGNLILSHLDTLKPFFTIITKHPMM